MTTFRGGTAVSHLHACLASVASLQVLRRIIRAVNPSATARLRDQTCDARECAKGNRTPARKYAREHYNDGQQHVLLYATVRPCTAFPRQKKRRQAERIEIYLSHLVTACRPAWCIITAVAAGGTGPAPFEIISGGRWFRSCGISRACRRAGCRFRCPDRHARNR